VANTAPDQVLAITVATTALGKC